jgi:hypothetical protein
MSANDQSGHCVFADVRQKLKVTSLKVVTGFGIKVDGLFVDREIPLIVGFS